MTINYVKIYHSLPKLYSYFLRIFFNGYALPPLHVFFELTYKCNLRCKMCQYLPIIENYHLTDSREKELTVSEIKGIIDQLPRYSLITFTGGEPFLRGDLLEILEYTSLKNKYHIVTNGTLLTEKISEKLVALGAKNFWGKGLLMIGLSLEGPRRIHDEIVGREGSFEKTLDGLRNINYFKKKKGSRFPLTNLAVVVSESNYESISDLVPFAEEKNIDVLSFLAENQFAITDRENTDAEEFHYYPSKQSNIDRHILKDQLDKIQSLLKKTKIQVRFSPPGVPVQYFANLYDPDVSMKRFTCLAPWAKVCIGAQGNVFPCPAANFGNVREYPLKKIWNNNAAREFRKRIRRKCLFPFCRGCCNLEHIR